MKPLIFILILLSFLQATFIPLDLVLIVILVRSYISADNKNLSLAFAFGLFVSFLNHQTLGVESLVYLLLVTVTHLLSKSPVSRNFLAVLPVILILLFLHSLILSLALRESLSIWPKILIEALLILPIYISLKFWEERFVVRPDVKLKLNSR
jgi:rod shape-determining protein MreD